MDLFLVFLEFTYETVAVYTRARHRETGRLKMKHKTTWVKLLAEEFLSGIIECDFGRTYYSTYINSCG